MKIALVQNDDFSIVHFRSGLIKTLIDQGHKVYALVPEGSYHQQLRDLNVNIITIKIDRFVSPINDLKLIFNLYRIFKEEKFDIVHNITIKPNIFSTLAAKLAGIKRIVCLVSGSGYMFSEAPRLSTRLLQLMMLNLYRFALLFSDKVWFQNKDDLDEFIAKGLMQAHRGIVIRGSGVNIDKFSMANINKNAVDELRNELGIEADKKCIVMVAARMIWSKGVKEFVEASLSLRSTHPDWVFVMLAPREEDSYEAVPADYINENLHDNLRIIDTFRDDVINFTALSDIMVLVSYYREGVPRSLLEGLSMQKPVVTTDSPGCREVIEDGQNGFLVPPQDTEAFIQKLDVLMRDDELRDKFGKHSRLIAKRDYDEYVVAERVLDEVYQLN